MITDNTQALYNALDRIKQLEERLTWKPIDSLQIETLCLLIDKDNNVCIGKKTEEKYNDLTSNVCLRKLHEYSWGVFYATHWLPIPEYEEK